MKCGPDGCPIVAFSDLTSAEQRVQRQRIAKKMSDQGFTEQQIAKQLGVDRSTISRDLSEFVHDAQIKKPAKTASNPKGAGRPKGKKPGQKQVQRSINTTPEEWEAFKTKAQQKGSSAAAALGNLIAPEIERSMLSMSAQEKFDAAIRAYKRKLDDEFQERCREDCMRWLNEVGLPHYLKELTKLERLISNRSGIMNRITYRKILSCLHPDRVQDTVMKKRYEEAFRLFTELEKRVLNEKESPTEFRTMPRTYEELMAMKAKVQAERRARRTAQAVRPR